MTSNAFFQLGFIRKPRPIYVISVRFHIISIFSIFSLIFFVINHITSFKQTYLFSIHFLEYILLLWGDNVDEVNLQVILPFNTKVPITRYKCSFLALFLLCSKIYVLMFPAFKNSTELHIRFSSIKSYTYLLEMPRLVKYFLLRR